MKGADSMSNPLKQLREDAGMTQDSVAQGMEVTVNTIQNWERNGKITKESLHSLLDLYNVDQAMRDKIVLQIFGREDNHEVDNEKDNFPYFLFQDRPDIIKAAKIVKLTVEEMDIFGYWRYIQEIDASNQSHFEGYPQNFPVNYEFFQHYGGYFIAMKKIKSISRRIGGFTSCYKLANVIYDYGLASPNKPFSFCSMTPQNIANNIQNLPNLEGKPIDISDLYDICKAVGNGLRIGTSEEFFLKTIPDILRRFIKRPEEYDYYWGRNHSHEPYTYTLTADRQTQKVICLEKQELKDPEYLNLKEQYIADQKAYNEHPNLYDHEPSFKYQFTYWLKLTALGEKYIHWIEG